MKTFEDLVDYCRKHGILQYEGPCGADRIRITFAPEAMLPISEEPVKSTTTVDIPAETAKSQAKRGRDKLTAEQQFDNYGVVLDAQE